LPEITGRICRSPVALNARGHCWPSPGWRLPTPVGSGRWRLDTARTPKYLRGL